MHTGAYFPIGPDLMSGPHVEITCARRGLFWVDLITTLPIETIVTSGLGITNTDDSRAIFLALIRWLKIVS